MFAWLRKNDRGFTLVELMMVIVILGILAGVAIPLIGNMREQAWKAKLAATADAIGTGAIYAAIQGKDVPDCDGGENGCNTAIRALANIPDDILVVGGKQYAKTDNKYYLIYVKEGKGISIDACKGDDDCDSSLFGTPKLYEFGDLEGAAASE